jgi:hypothetical protein
MTNAPAGFVDGAEVTVGLLTADGVEPPPDAVWLPQPDRAITVAAAIETGARTHKFIFT